MSDSFSASSSSPALPLVLAPDAQADAAVLAADALDFAQQADAEGEGDPGAPEDFDTPESRLEARTTYEPEDGLAARDTLEQALDAVELEDMTALEVAELESGDAARMAAVLKVKDARPADADAHAPTRAEDGSGLSRVSLKALPPAARLKLVSAISRVRDGGDFETALREMFSLSGREDGAPGQAFENAEAWVDADSAAGDAEGGSGTPEVTGRPEARPTGVEGEMPLTQMEGRLAEMRAAYDQAKAEYDPQAQDLLEAMMDLKLEVREAQRGQAAFEQGQLSSYERAAAEHADLMGDAGSPFMDLCDMTISLAEQNNDPILREPDWPERIAKQVRGRFFQGAAAWSAAPGGGWPQGQAPAMPRVPPAPQQKMRFTGSPVGNGYAPGSVTAETALAEFDQLSPEEQEATLAEIAKATDGRRR